ncbi:hypothetical protein T10_7123 [Trichinella papuae]|uniref:Uncharacterized protein n=1 Tax=Trichinella papuae TaxID=268474 RepID=A0A0V1M3C8_9BILA|nr:hypothetical protein T10_7123 [Trichinella papuae]
MMSNSAADISALRASFPIAVSASRLSAVDVIRDLLHRQSAGGDRKQFEYQSHHRTCTASRSVP